VESAPSANTRLPAPLAVLAPPNPCLVTAFAEEQERNCRAQDCGFGNLGTLYAMRPKTCGPSWAASKTVNQK